MRALILHDAVPDDARADELEVLEQVRAVAAALQRAGHAVEYAAFGTDQSAVEVCVRSARPDVIFNLVEAVDRSMRGISAAPALLAKIGIPFTGSGEEPMRSSTNKVLAKGTLVAAGIPTPAWMTLDELRGGASAAAGRWILKSVWEHGSFGLEDDNVVETCEGGGLRQPLEARLPALGGEGFAEAYVEGREFNVALLEIDGLPAVLPPGEIVFRDWPPDRPKVVGWRSKWAEQSFEYTHTARRYDFEDDDARLIEELHRLALRCWSAFDLSGYARVDFRVDAADRPFVLEVNANPTLAPDAGFAAAAIRSGRSLDDAILSILQAAHSTRGQPGRAPQPAPGCGCRSRDGL